MKKTLVAGFIFLFLTGFVSGQKYKIEYGLTPVAFLFPAGAGFGDNLYPSVAVGAYGFYNLADTLAIGLDGIYGFHFTGKTHSSYKIVLARVSPSVKVQKYFGNFKIYALFGYGVYRWQSSASFENPSRSGTSSGLRAETGIMFKTAPGWEIGINAGYDYANDIGGFKPARYFSSAIKAGILL